MPLRFVNNWKDLNDALRDLFNWKDQQSNGNLDFHQRQIKNAHVSIDDFDYVVRKELRDATVGQQPFSQQQVSNTTPSGGSGGPGYDKITFGLGVSSMIEPGGPQTPPFIWSNPRKGVISKIYIACNVPPVGGHVGIDIILNGGSIFVSQPNPIFIDVTYQAGTVITPSSAVTPGIQIAERDTVQAAANEVTATSGARSITVVIFCNLL